ncbi:hypothetical protein HPB48_006351 [Haemaphysalis longicornis]|uniref:Partial AB-hydrolase lipase domain-containing protein n=1 Tax=Haemaphysalis longicornis TaxID=44386 RepID=A0A9J6GZ90_HAELO|nr:hypothetical protein HPB48_006351 [Haemaphysalis longicornis]
MTSSATKPVVLVLTVLSHGLLPVPAKKTALYTGNDPDSCTGVEGLVTSKGYPFEKHSVVTSDGYVIEMHRIPRGRDGCASPCHGHPILLMSGLLGDSSNWVLDFPKQSLGFVLADRGYDVWMGNVRGSTYGKQHKSLQVQSKEFWNFTFHEHAILDLPAQIDYVLEFTGTKAVPYVGVSQGTLIFFTMMSERPEYNQKV